LLERKPIVVHPDNYSIGSGFKTEDARVSFNLNEQKDPKTEFLLESARVNKKLRRQKRMRDKKRIEEEEFYY